MAFNNRESKQEIKEKYSFIFSNNPDEVETCMLLRNEVYKALNGYHVTADVYDRVGDVLVIKKSDKIIGSARISCVDSYSSAKLPLERHNFNLNDIVPEINKYRICECSRMFLISEEHNNEVVTSALEAFIQEAVARKCDYVFYVTRPTLIKYFEFVCSGLGYKPLITSQKAVIDYTTKKVEVHLCCVRLALQEIQRKDGCIV